MNHRARWALLGAACAAAASVVAVGTGWATAPVGLTNTPLARGTNASKGNLRIQNGMDGAMAQITVDPGGSSGWHSHPGGAIIVVQQGTLTIYRSHGSHCRTETYNAGQAFIERPGEVTDVVNNSTAPYTLFVTFPRVP